MGNTYSQNLLVSVLRNERSPGDLDRALAEDEGRAFLSVVVERLGDLFDPELCPVYERLFRDVIATVSPELLPRLRVPGTQSAPATTSRVYVLSRITLGADVAVTSVMLDAAKKRYPDAEIVFVGPRKSYEMFEADPRVRHLEAPYARGGTLIERLAASASLHFDDGIVIDPDSRLTQLGLISVCDEDRYFFFNSRAYKVGLRLPEAASEWVRETFGVKGARPYVAPLPFHGPIPDITVSLGVGENPAKRMDEDFERNLMRILSGTGAAILVDHGGSAGERERVERAVLPGIRTHSGTFASFAAHIAQSKFYVGYDSAGQHVASACRIPLICIFKGQVNERFLNRWSPIGTVIRADILEQVRAAITCTFRR